MPAGVPHCEGNPGAAEIDGVVELRPALRAKELHGAFAGRVADGRTTPKGAPRNPLQLGATFWHFRYESRVTSPPIWVQNLMLPPLWALAKAVGVRPYHRHWKPDLKGPSSRGQGPGPGRQDPSPYRRPHSCGPGIPALASPCPITWNYRGHERTCAGRR